MNPRIILSLIIISLGATAAILPSKKNDSLLLNEKQLLQEMLLETNYISVDELADLLIQGDPSIQLIDVRSVSELKEPLPRAINIPVDSIFSPNYDYLFDQDVRKNIIYGLNDQKAVQVWMLTKQLGYKNNYLLKGGLKAWRSSILNPPYPDATASKDAFDLYNKRLAAKQYFTGVKAIPQTDVVAPIPVPKRKKKRVQGGCS